MKIKYLKSLLFSIMLMVASVGIANGQTFTNKINVLNGSSGPCPGAYQAKTTFLLNDTNAAKFFSVPTGKTNFIATYSGGSTNIPIIRINRKHDFNTKCSLSPFNGVTSYGSVGATHQFSIETFWTSSAGLVTGQTSIVSVTWMP